jgi:hypothetical protein
MGDGPRLDVFPAAAKLHALGAGTCTESAARWRTSTAMIAFVIQATGARPGDNQ